MQEKLCVCQDFFGCNLNSFAKKQQKEKSDSAMESDFSNEPAIWLNIIVLFPQEYLTKVRQTFGGAYFYEKKEGMEHKILARIKNICYTRYAK